MRDMVINFVEVVIITYMGDITSVHYFTYSACCIEAIVHSIRNFNCRKNFILHTLYTKISPNSLPMDDEGTESCITVDSL